MGYQRSNVRGQRTEGESDQGGREQARTWKPTEEPGGDGRARRLCGAGVMGVTGVTGVARVAASRCSGAGSQHALGGLRKE